MLTSTGFPRNTDLVSGCSGRADTRWGRPSCRSLHRHAPTHKRRAKQQPGLAALPRAGCARWCLPSRNAWSLQHRRSALRCPWHQLIAWPAPLIASCSIGCHIFCVASVPTAVWQCRCNWIGRRTCHCSKWWWVCEKIFVPAQADAFRRRNGQVSASRFFLWVCLADLVAVLWHAGQLVLSGEQAGGLRGCRWLCGPAGLGTRNCTGECAVRRWASWWLSLWLHLVVLSGHALPPGIGPGNAQMGQLVAGTAAAGGWQIADGRRRGARGQVVAGGGIGTH